MSHYYNSDETQAANHIVISMHTDFITKTSDGLLELRYAQIHFYLLYLRFTGFLISYEFPYRYLLSNPHPLLLHVQAYTYVVLR